jgi:hypothetical protein
MIRSMGIAVPTEYARVMTSASIVTAPEMARVMTEANMGPTHGVQRRPSDKPISMPPQNPAALDFLGVLDAKPDSSISSFTCTEGMSMDTPRPAMKTTDRIRSRSALTPKADTSVDRKSVKKVKLTMKPVTIPSGFDFPVSTPPTVEDSIIGNIGKIHGESIVTTPARKANAISRNIGYPR